MRKTTFALLTSSLIALVCVELGLRFIGGVLLNKAKTKTPGAQKSTYRILTVGESTTFSGGGDDSWPSQLETILNERYASEGTRFSVINKGIPATTTTGIVSRLEGDIAEVKPHIIVSMMGINDGLESLQSSFILTTDERVGNRWVSSLKNLRLAKFIRFAFSKGSDLARLYYDLYVERNPRELADRLAWYQQTFGWSVAERIINKIQTFQSQDADVYASIARVYRKSFMLHDAERAYEQSRSIDPYSQVVLVEYADTLNNITFSGADGYLEKARNFYFEELETNPVNTALLKNFGRLEFYGGDIEESRVYYEKVARLDKTDADVYAMLGAIHHRLNDDDSAEYFFKEAIRINPRSDLAIPAYIEFLHASGRTRDVERLEDRASKLVSTSVSKTTENYRRLLSIAKKHNIHVIAMQYPMRDVTDLITQLTGSYSAAISRDVLGSQTDDSFTIEANEQPVIVVNNRSVFEEALRLHVYDELFSDRFAIDFGHTTKLGNTIIATNLANNISMHFMSNTIK